MSQSESDDREDQAAQDAWETGQGRGADRVHDAQLADLHAAFEAMPSVRALRRAIQGAQDDPADPVATVIDLQPGLAALLTRIEEADAAEAGREPLPLRRVLSQLVSNQLENLLHALAADPTEHAHYAKLWNALCAEKGQLTYQIPDSTPQNRPEKAEEGPF